MAAAAAVLSWEETAVEMDIISFHDDKTSVVSSSHRAATTQGVVVEAGTNNGSVEQPATSTTIFGNTAAATTSTTVGSGTLPDNFRLAAPCPDDDAMPPLFLPTGPTTFTDNNNNEQQEVVDMTITTTARAFAGPSRRAATQQAVDQSNEVQIQQQQQQQPLSDESLSMSGEQQQQQPGTHQLQLQQHRCQHHHHQPSFAVPTKSCKRSRIVVVAVVVLQTVLLLAAMICIILLSLKIQSYHGTYMNGQGFKPVDSNHPNQQRTTLSAIRNRKNLVCGIVEYTTGFSMFNDTTGEWNGFEIDLCRAIGSAIFGEDGHVNFNNLSNSTISERFIALQSGRVDVLAAGVTYTMERDFYEPTSKAGFTFSVPYLYNGVSFAGQPHYVDCADRLDTNTGNCSGLTICVQDDTTHVQVVANMFRGRSSSVIINLVPSMKDFYGNFTQGICNVLAGEQFDLALVHVQRLGYNDAYSLSKNLYSKEPLALVTRDDNAEWSDFVNWVVLALLTAENKTITQEYAAPNHRAPSVKTSQLPFYDAVATVGNYAEMYDRHLQSIVPRTAPNTQNVGLTPLIYSLPFGNNTTMGPGPVANGTLERILRRGYLLCGNAATPFFAKFNHNTQEWNGFNVDFCRAVSAAIFNGTGSTVFVPVTGANRFELLASGAIDLISWDTTWNYERDVKEPTTGSGFTFTQPVLYAAHQFGGVPPFTSCAERVDVLSSQCYGLKICVNHGTTEIKQLYMLFRNRSIVPVDHKTQLYECLRNNDGNVVFADSFLIANATVQESGYNGAYQEGTKSLSRETLAMVTRQDDSQWSSFVNWVVMAIFYAEEHNITQATYYQMPTTNILGEGFTFMFQNVIQGVGSYREIIARHATGKYEISALNNLNGKLHGPQHFPPGGLFGLY